MAYTNIDDPSAYFQTALWTGTGSVGNAVTFDGNSDMQPDMVWSKRRDSASKPCFKRYFKQAAHLIMIYTLYQIGTNCC
jgi:hypothetical protein